jgi:histidine ammonia-lyase
LRLLTAIELVVAAQAVDLAAIGELGTGTRSVHTAVRELVEPFESERPLGGDVERVAAELARLTAAAAA